MPRGERVLAVPQLGEQSGGVGQVCSLLWRAIEQTWPGHSAVVALLRDGRMSPTLADKLGFGYAVGGRQLVRRARWILFAHLGLARVERYVPSGARAPYAVFFHGVEAWDRLAAADLAVLSRAHLRLANSAFTARRIGAVNPEIGAIDVCPLALPGEPDGPGRDPADRPDGKTVLIVGRLSAGERYKGHEQLIDAWPDVLAREPDAELVIAGDGDDRPRLEAQARSGRAAHRIRFVGFVPRADLERLYAQAVVFAMPSRNEGFGLVYLEAMAHRLPCVGSIHDAAGEIVRDGETGLLVDSDNRREIAGAVLELLGDSGLRQRMGQAGYERWRRVYTFDRFRERAVSLLESAFEPERTQAQLA